MELAGHHPRSYVREKPAPDFAPDLLIGPVALFEWHFRAGIFE